MTNKSLHIAYLLWLFTGVFGGHWWYLERKLLATINSILGLVFLSVLLVNFFLINDTAQQSFDLFSMAVFNPTLLMLNDGHQFNSPGGFFIGLAQDMFVTLLWVNIFSLINDLFKIYFVFKKIQHPHSTAG